MAALKMKYTNLGSSGLRVSRICVGCMSYGDPSGRFSWSLPEAEALPLLQECYEAGINFYDTANAYSNGASEVILGKAIKKGNWKRNNIVIATKLWAPVGYEPEDNPLSMSNDEREAGGYLNSFGLSRKHIFEAVDASLKRLDLPYVDLLQIHRFDPLTPPKETMEALNDVVRSGKVRYIGASSMWAHQLLEYQYTARQHGYAEFISMQNLHNPIYREEEREMIPSLKKFGMGMIPWSPVAMGFLTRPHSSDASQTARSESMKGTFMGNAFTENDKRTNERIQQIAEKRGVSMAVISLAWSLSKPFMTAPIVGMSKSDRIKEAVQAVHFELSEEEIKSIDELYQPRAVIGFS